MIPDQEIYRVVSVTRLVKEHEMLAKIKNSPKIYKKIESHKNHELQ